MRAAHIMDPTLGAAAAERVPSEPALRLRARMHAGRLDRDLASGIATWHSPLHAARALQLTSPRRRHSLAISLEQIVELARAPTSVRISATIPPSREQVCEALGVIKGIAALLRSPEPVDAHGMARLSALLCNGGSPFYVHNRPGALVAALQAVSQWLDVTP